MNIRGLRAGLTILLLAVTTGLSADFDFRQHQAVQESLSRVHPRFRAEWLRGRGLDDSYYTTFHPQDTDSGLRCVGRWSYGPAYDVDGQTTPSETLVALARGSGVSLLRFSRQDSLSIELLSDVNAGGIVTRVAVRDSLLYVGSTAGLEVYDITDKEHPVRRVRIATALSDFALQDSMAYIIGSDDSFKVYNIADPVNPAFRGACTDSGDCVAIAGHAALLAHRWGLYVLDITDPAAPHRVNTWGTSLVSVTTRGNTAFAASDNPNQPGELTLSVLDVSVPTSVVTLGSIGGPGGYDLCLADTLIFCSGDGVHTTMDIVSIADSTQPRLLGSGPTTGWCMGVWATAAGGAAFIADNYEGLWAFDVDNPASPVHDTSLLRADMAEDICTDNAKAYVANDRDGLQILDVSDPTKPSWLACYDSAGSPPGASAVTARDSFVFVTWEARYGQYFRSVDVHDPAHPTYAGAGTLFNPPKAMAMRDSFVYVAEYARFQVVNVADPRAPVLWGSCVIQGAGVGVLLRDTLAYVSSLPTQIINVSNPTAPVVIGSMPPYGYGVALIDTFLFLPAAYDSMVVYSVANPASPVRLTSVILSGGHIFNRGVALVGTRLYVGGDVMHVLDVSSPANPLEVASWRLPYDVGKLHYAEPYIYAACYDAGVCVLETLHVGLEDVAAQPQVHPCITVEPSPARQRMTVRCPITAQDVRVLDITGREVARVRLNEGVAEVALVGLRPGVYFCSVIEGGSGEAAKFVKQ
jgi:hypothetical protein